MKKGHSPRSIRAIAAARDNYRCRYCGVQTRLRDQNHPKLRTADHLIPVCKGGRLTLANIVTACQKCNSKKGHKTLKEVGMKLLPRPFVTPEQLADWQTRGKRDACTMCNLSRRMHIPVFVPDREHGQVIMRCKRGTGYYESKYGIKCMTASRKYQPCD